MNKDIFKGTWKQTKGKVKEMWGNLTDDEVDKIEGNYDNLVGTVQKKYGYSKDETLSKVNEFLKRVTNSVEGEEVRRQPR